MSKGTRRLNTCLLAAATLLCVSCSSSTPIEKNTTRGFIEGHLLYIGSAMPGKLTQLLVKRGQVIEAKTLLFKLDPQPQQAELAASEAKLEKERHALTGLLQKAQDETTQHLIAVQQTLIKLAEADVSKDQWELNAKTLHAPRAGRVTDVLYQVGEFVPEGKSVVALLTPHNIKVSFFLSQKALAEVKLNETIFFECETCVKRQKATIDFIAHDPSSQHKLNYRVEASIPTDAALKYRPGQPVKVKY